MFPRDHEGHTCMHGKEVQCPFLNVSYDPEFISENGGPFLCLKGTEMLRKKFGIIPMIRYVGHCSGHPDYEQFR